MKHPVRCAAIIGLAVAAAAVVATFFAVRKKVKTETQKTTMTRIDDVPREYWATLAEKKIFFGHKSVGTNIIDGIRDIMKEHDYIKLNIVETADPSDFDRPLFAHAHIGNNTDPSSKINAFKDIMESGVARKADIAFFKFCYVDTFRGADPKDIFDEYSAVMDELSNKYPRTRFLHVTMPLSSPPKGLRKEVKSFLKSILGKEGVPEENVRREKYNDLLHEAYSGKEKIFDLALVETIGPGGSRCYVEKKGKKIFVLAPEYTTDGGHLNKEGRKKVAEQFLVALARLANER